MKSQFPSELQAAVPARKWFGGSHRSNTARLWTEPGSRPGRPDILCGLCQLPPQKLLEHWPGFASFHPEPGTPDYKVTYRLSSSSPVSFGEEWSGEGWRAAATFTFELMRDLLRGDLMLRAIPPWHIQFRGCEAVCVNPGAACAFEEAGFRASIECVARAFLLPLRAWAIGRADLAMMHSRQRRWLQPEDYLRLKEFWDPIALSCRSDPPPEAAEKWLAAAQATVLPDHDSFWSKYYPAAVGPEDYTLVGHKAQAVATVLDLVGARTALDLGANVGLYSRMAAKRGISVVATDNDGICVNRMFRAVRQSKEDVLPLVMDISDPSPAAGMGYDEFPSAHDRFRSEMVIALAISHHLALSPRRQTFDQIAAAFASLATRWLLTEFVSFEPESHNPYTPDAVPGCQAWYTLEGFLAALTKHFRTADVLPGPPKGRRLIFCEK